MLQRPIVAPDGITAELTASVRSIGPDLAADRRPRAGRTARDLTVGLLKHVTTQNAVEALKPAGNRAIARRNPLERHWRDVLCARIHGPREDTILINAGRRAFGQ